MSLGQFLAPVIPAFPSVREDAEVEVLSEIPIETLYLALKAADSLSVQWFYDNAQPEQIQGVLDLDCWNGDTFLPERFNFAFRHIAATHPVKIDLLMRHLDPELIVRGLLELAQVIDFDPQDPPSVPEENLVLTPDSRYALVLTEALPEEREALIQWLNKASAANLELLRRHLESCKWEQKSDLEEFGYRIKRGRLEDMGFVDRGEAIGLYARGAAADLKQKLIENPLEAGTKRSAIPARDEASDDAPEVFNESFLPQAISGAIFSEGFLSDALRNVKDASLKQLLLSEVLRTVNAALAADDLLHADLLKIGMGARRARLYLDLGLAYLADGQASTGAKMLEDQPLGDVFRLGWLVIQDLVKVARDTLVRYPAGIFGPEDEALLRALSGRHPELDARQLKLLAPQSSSLVSMGAALSVGARVAILSQIGLYLSKDLANALKLSEMPLRLNESGYSRLLLALFRETSGAPASAQALSFEEWDRLSTRFAQGDGETLLRKAAAMVAERCPKGALAHFELRFSEVLRELTEFIKTKPGVRPDPRFFRALSFAEAAQS